MNKSKFSISKNNTLLIISLLLTGNQVVAGVNEANQSIISRSLGPGNSINFINHGLVVGQDYFNIGSGQIENDGNMLFPVNVTCRGNKIINLPKGYIAFGGYIDCYLPGGTKPLAIIENAGTIAVINGVGDSSYNEWTAEFNGKIINQATGKFLVDRNNSFNLLPNGSHVPSIENSGYFEIAQGSIWDARDLPEGSYIQLAGETRINGTFGAYKITINEGVISGSGTIQGDFNNSPLFDKVTIAPGSSLETGTLTFTPDETYLMCVRCSIAIELASATNADQVHIDGEFDMNNWKLNVQLRDGYVPAAGTSFTVVSADSVYYYGPAPTYNLPKLPNGRTWNVQNNGTEVILTAN